MADGLEQLLPFSIPTLAIPLDVCRKQLRPLLQELLLPLRHLLRVYLVFFSDLSKLLPNTNRFKCHLELQFLSPNVFLAIAIPLYWTATIGYCPVSGVYHGGSMEPVPKYRQGERRGTISLNLRSSIKSNFKR